MTATTRTTARRPTLEELVDRVIEAIFGEQLSPPAPTASPARTIHEARRLGRKGELDAALALFAELNLRDASEAEAQWAYAEFVDLALRRFPDEGALVYSPGPGRAAALTPAGDGLLKVRATLGMRWRADKLISQRSLRGLRLYRKGRAP